MRIKLRGESLKRLGNEQWNGGGIRNKPPRRPSNLFATKDQVDFWMEYPIFLAILRACSTVISRSTGGTSA